MCQPQTVCAVRLREVLHNEKEHFTSLAPSFPHSPHWLTHLSPSLMSLSSHPFDIKYVYSTQKNTQTVEKNAHDYIRLFYYRIHERLKRDTMQVMIACSAVHVHLLPRAHSQPNTNIVSSSVSCVFFLFLLILNIFQ